MTYCLQVVLGNVRNIYEYIVYICYTILLINNFKILIFHYSETDRVAVLNPDHSTFRMRLLQTFFLIHIFYLKI